MAGMSHSLSAEILPGVIFASLPNDWIITKSGRIKSPRNLPRRNLLQTLLLMKKGSRNFTLLEVMVGIALLAIASSAIFWKLQRMIERKRFDSDANRIRSTLISTRSLAINTKMDFYFEFKETKEGWNGRIVCREDSDLVYPMPRFSPL